MPDMLEEYARQTIDEILKTLPIEKRLEGLSAEELRERLTVAQRLQGLSPEQRLQGLSAEELHALADKLKGNGASAKPE